MEELKLYLIVFECEFHSMEADWFHLVSDHPIQYDEGVRLVREFILANDDLDEEEARELEIENVWINLVNEVDELKIKLVKE